MSIRVRGFEVLADKHRTVPGVEVILPHRGTKWSAGYDFHALERKTIRPDQVVEFNTDVKAYMKSDEVLKLHPRSSIGIKQGLIIANTIPVIDADYYGNPKNDGHIAIWLRNMTKEAVVIDVGDRIAQGIFQKYLIADNDPDDLPERTGGTGSTGR